MFIPDSRVRLQLIGRENYQYQLASAPAVKLAYPIYFFVFPRLIKKKNAFSKSVSTHNAYQIVQILIYISIDWQIYD